MLKLNAHPAGRHFLQIPGPSPVPDRILRAMSYPTIDHRGPEFGVLGLKVIDGIKKISDRSREWREITNHQGMGDSTVVVEES